MNYYDEYGVVADMLQNHLTEVALMVSHISVRLLFGCCRRPRVVLFFVRLFMSD